MQCAFTKVGTQKKTQQSAFLTALLMDYPAVVYISQKCTCPHSIPTVSKHILVCRLHVFMAVFLQLKLKLRCDGTRELTCLLLKQDI